VENSIKIRRIVRRWNMRRYSAGLRAGWSRIRVSAGVGNFSLHHCVQTGSGSSPDPYPVGNKSSFLGGKAAVARRWPFTSILCRGQDCVEL